jgi:hypothetical protein
MRLHRAALVALCSVFVQLACSESDRAGSPHPSGSGGSAQAGGTSVSRGGSSGSASGGAESAGTPGAGAPNDAGAGGLGSEPEPFVCPPERVWSHAERLEVSTAGSDELVGICADELCIAWFADGALRFAERRSPSADFASPVSIDAGEDYFGGAALSSDGLSIIAVRNDGKAFGLLRRASRSAPFQGVPDEMPFTEIAAAPSTFRALGPFGDPVLSPNGLRLLFSDLDPSSDATPSIYEATRLGARDAWSFGDPVLGEFLLSDSGRFRRPSALSADERTLFYWDEVANVGRAAFRSFVGAQFESSVSLGARSHAVPTPACDRLYYSAPGAQGIDLFVEKAE